VIRPEDAGIRLDPVPSTLPRRHKLAIGLVALALWAAGVVAVLLGGVL
jgi:hypothetical protein